MGLAEPPTERSFRMLVEMLAALAMLGTLLVGMLAEHRPSPANQLDEPRRAKTRRAKRTPPRPRFETSRPSDSERRRPRGDGSQISRRSAPATADRLPSTGSNDYEPRPATLGDHPRGAGPRRALEPSTTRPGRSAARVAGRGRTARGDPGRRRPGFRVGPRAECDPSPA